ncbi:MAG: S1 RNA-binding domain-containing protein, partial [Deltaproteobacteria bacterium]|nr:S1 RNA-binding domain-containing protein [Deltaproteobacteria bacterium]
VLGTPDKSALPSGKKLLAACERCNECERTAQDAEREITRRLACLLLEPRVGESFSCVISGVTPFGLFAEPEDFPVEGLIKIESLTDDWYIYDETRQMLLGSRTGKSWRLGQEISARLEAVSLDRLEIDFRIAGESGMPDSAPHGKHIRRRPLKDTAPMGRWRGKSSAHERKAGHAKSHAASRRRRRG